MICFGKYTLFSQNSNINYPTFFSFISPEKRVELLGGVLEAVELAELGNDEDYRHYGSHGVGGGEGCPHAIKPEVGRQNEQHRYDEYPGE